MKSLNLLAVSALATLTLVSGLISAKSASAQPAGFDGSYVCLLYTSDAADE